jgi:hypothetical protein
MHMRKTDINGQLVMSGMHAEIVMKMDQIQIVFMDAI